MCSLKRTRKFKSDIIFFFTYFKTKSLQDFPAHQREKMWTIPAQWAAQFRLKTYSPGSLPSLNITLTANSETLHLENKTFSKNSEVSSLS